MVSNHHVSLQTHGSITMRILHETEVPRDLGFEVAEVATRFPRSPARTPEARPTAATVPAEIQLSIVK